MFVRSRCPPWQDEDLRELPAFVSDMARAWQLAQSDAKTKPIRLDVLETWHGIAFASVAPRASYAGNVRQCEHPDTCLCIGVFIEDKSGARYEGSPPDVAARECDALLELAHKLFAELEQEWAGYSTEEITGLLAQAIGTLVGEFIRIHPFVNGNGRTSRMLWRAILHRYGVVTGLSLCTRPLEPYSEVMAAAMRGEFVPLIEMVLGCMHDGDLVRCP